MHPNLNTITVRDVRRTLDELKKSVALLTEKNNNRTGNTPKNTCSLQRHRQLIIELPEPRRVA